MSQVRGCSPLFPPFFLSESLFMDDKDLRQRGWGTLYQKASNVNTLAIETQILAATEATSADCNKYVIKNE